jgi:hypothetical protein
MKVGRGKETEREKEKEERQKKEKYEDRSSEENLYLLRINLNRKHGEVFEISPCLPPFLLRMSFRLHLHILLQLF